MEVIMDEDVPHSDDLEPRDILVLFLKFVGDSGRRLAKDLNMVQDPGLDEFVTSKCVFATGGVPLYILYGFANIP